jgi:hypothetical protein
MVLLLLEIWQWPVHWIPATVYDAAARIRTSLCSASRALPVSVVAHTVPSTHQRRFYTAVNIVLNICIKHLYSQNVPETVRALQSALRRHTWSAQLLSGHVEAQIMTHKSSHSCVRGVPPTTACLLAVPGETNRSVGWSSWRGALVEPPVRPWAKMSPMCEWIGVKCPVACEKPKEEDSVPSIITKAYPGRSLELLPYHRTPWLLQGTMVLVA